MLHNRINAPMLVEYIVRSGPMQRVVRALNHADAAGEAIRQEIELNDDARLSSVCQVRESWMCEDHEDARWCATQKIMDDYIPGESEMWSGL